MPKQIRRGQLPQADSPIALEANRPAIANDLSFEFVHPDKLKPYPHTAHRHPKEQIAQLRASIRAHGVVGAIITDEDGEIINGEAVWRAAKAEGKVSIPVIRRHDLSEAQKRALRIGLNKHAQNAEWDLDQLRVEMQGILAANIDFDPGEIGMSSGEIDKLFIAKDSDPADDAIPSLASRAVSREGDIWILLSHRVGCGDCRDLVFLRRVVGDRLVDCCVTDPPYNQRIAGGATTGRGKTHHSEFAMASGEMSAQDFGRFLKSALDGFVKVSRDGAVHYVCMDHQHVEILLSAGEEVYGRRLNICVWSKSNAGMGGLYRNQHELVCVFTVGEASYFNAVQLGKHGRNRTNVWTYPSVNTFGGSRRRDLELHPTVKPVALVADAIMDVTRRGELVLDGFLGSGTCLLACERTGRLCRGVEIDPLYVDLALERWSERTGVEPVLESTGQTFAQVRAERLARETGNV